MVGDRIQTLKMQVMQSMHLTSRVYLRYMQLKQISSQLMLHIEYKNVKDSFSLKTTVYTTTTKIFFYI